MMKLLPAFCLLLPILASAAPSILELQKTLNQTIMPEGAPLEQVRSFVENRVPAVPDIQDPEEWRKYCDQLRKDILEKVVFRGNLAPFWNKQKNGVVYEELLKPHPDYSIQKLRFQILPGWWCPALLYIPSNLPEGKKVPVILNVNGHDKKGKAAPYKQIRCIHQARNGMLAMNVEWIGMGQFKDRMSHYHIGQLDLCGISGLSPFYMNMSKALDVALEHPNADPEKVAVAGLSGGGWQTIFFSALDTRVKLANPVAGYSSFLTRARYPSDLGDSEQTPNDLATLADYTHLTALLSDRALLLTKNAEDKCCFAAPHALPPLKAAAEPKFKLLGREKYFRTHINTDPGTHNFEADNRQQFYKMLGFTFFDSDTAIPLKEKHSEKEILTPEQLHAPLPEKNIDIHFIAKTYSKGLPLPHPMASPFTETIELKHAAPDLHKVLRTAAYPITPQQISTEKLTDGTTAASWMLHLNNEWTVPMLELTPSGEVKKTVILIGDQGRNSLAEITSENLRKGNRVLLLDLFYFGENKLGKQDFLYAILVAAVGERPLGIQISQMAAIADWAIKNYKAELIDIESKGPRTSFIALTSATLSPNRFGKVALHSPLESLKSLIRNGFGSNRYPELFCFGLLKYFDIPGLIKLANTEDPERVTIRK